jgi:hypothetical protein
MCKASRVTAFSLEALICRRTLGGLACGGARADVRAALGPPDESSGPTVERSAIWRYGSFEVHFDGDRVHMFFTDHLDEIDPGPGRTVDPWILERMTDPTWDDVLAELRRVQVAFELGRDRAGQQLVTIVGGSELGFEDDPEIGRGRWSWIVAYPAGG